MDGEQAGGERSPESQGFSVATPLRQQRPVAPMCREVAGFGVRLQVNPHLPEMQTHNPSAASELSEPRGPRGPRGPRAVDLALRSGDSFSPQDPVP